LRVVVRVVRGRNLKREEKRIEGGDGEVGEGEAEGLGDGGILVVRFG
jgi:hypothetical protein